MDIMLVDDDSGIRKNLSKFLIQNGHSVVSCKDGKEAYELLLKESFHLVLSDIQMPQMDGYELLKKIKSNPSLENTIVILITGYGDVKNAIEAMQIGAYDYLLKPVDIEELLAMIDRISEFLALKNDFSILKDDFDRKVEEATQDIKEQLIEIKKAYSRELGTADIGVYSEAMRMLYNKAGQLHINSDVPVLIEGETGTGKEVIARYIHYGTGEVTTPFIAINCTAISPALFESELFGYEAGAFTGGNPKGQKGKFELAENGSIFLDEIGELPPEYQAKLLRVLQEKEFFRVGGLKKMINRARVICATNQDVKKKIEEGLFRKDLYYRLNVGKLTIPPLRDRKEEIVPLAKLFLFQIGRQKSTRFSRIDRDACRILEEYSWPGNVRELKNAIEFVVVFHNDTEIQPHHLDFLRRSRTESNLQQFSSPIEAILESNFQMPENAFNLNTLILEVVRNALEKQKGNKNETAKYLDISRHVLYTYLKRIEESEQ